MGNNAVANTINSISIIIVATLTPAAELPKYLTIIPRAYAAPGSNITLKVRHQLPHTSLQLNFSAPNIPLLSNKIAGIKNRKNTKAHMPGTTKSNTPKNDNETTVNLVTARLDNLCHTIVHDSLNVSGAVTVRTMLYIRCMIKLKKYVAITNAIIVALMTIMTLLADNLLIVTPAGRKYLNTFSIPAMINILIKNKYQMLLKVSLYNANPCLYSFDTDNGCSANLNMIPPPRFSFV